MFTGIVEAMGEVKALEAEGTNRHIFMEVPFLGELKVDQSVAHNGVCLTVAAIQDSVYRVTAIQETLDCSNLGELRVGDKVNLERCMLANGRFDGHIVQGHVDTTAICTSIENKNGSWVFWFACQHPEFNQLVVPKGSITVNGISLTVAGLKPFAFSVAIIPYTFEHTNLGQIVVGNTVNIEFDILGKYVAARLVLGKDA